MKGFRVQALPIPVEGAVAVVALAVGANGKVYAGLTAFGHVLVEIDPRTDRMRDCGPLIPQAPKGEAKVLDKLHNALVAAPDGRLYLGQGLNIGWRNEGGFDFLRYGGGHIYAFDPATNRCEDLGPPVRANAIHGLALDPDGEWLYGYSMPDNHFFAFHVPTREALDCGKISEYCCHNFVAARPGLVYGAWQRTGRPRTEDAEDAADPRRMPGIFLAKYVGADRRLLRTPTRLLFGHEDLFGNRGVDAWLRTRAGRVFCGTVMGGLLLEVDPATDAVRYVGKPVEGPRLSGLVEAEDGTIFGTAGFPRMHLFAFDPRTERFTDFGAVVTEHPLCYFHGIAILPDGTLYVGETDSQRALVYKLTPE